MAYVALYRKWRPMTFDEVVEQGAVVRILKNAVMTDRIAHAYLFCGTRGTGKTTLAKIFARAVNCLNPKDGNPCNECDICKGIINGQILDVEEIDAASNNGVDNIRAIIDETAYASSVARFRVYIIDEVHMLSSGAFNALLKTLEEPPEGVIFILATTEPHKLPVTILSRCQRYDFKRISQDGIVSRLREICDAADIKYIPEALHFLAHMADGALRDAISLLDQTIASCNSTLTLAAAREAVGALDKAVMYDFAQAIIASDAGTVLDMTSTLFADGRDPSHFLSELTGVFRDMLVMRTLNDVSGVIYEDEDGMRRLKDLCSRVSGTAEISLFIQALARLESDIKWSVQRKIMFETGMLALCDRKWSADDELSRRITALEERLSDLVTVGLKVSAMDRRNSDKFENISKDNGNAVVQQAATSAQTATSTQTATSAQAAISEQADHIELSGDFEQESASQQLSGHNSNERHEVDQLVWKSYLDSLKLPYPIMSILKHCHGIIAGDTLALVFEQGFYKDKASQQVPIATLRNAAESLFKRPLDIMLALETEVDEALPLQTIISQTPTQARKNATAENVDNDIFTRNLDELDLMSKEPGNAGMIINEVD